MRLDLKGRERGGGGDCSELSVVRVALDFRKLILASPLSPETLQAEGLTQIEKSARSAGRGEKAILLELSDAGFQHMAQLADNVKPSGGWPATWNITPGSVVKRAKLHEIYGGNPRVWASSSGMTPNAFLFLSSSRAAELAPRWTGDTLLAGGQGQLWDSVSLENLAVLAHQRRGVPLRVFMVRGSECLYLGEFASDPQRPVERWPVTGQRKLRFSSTVQDVRTPIFRIRQLSGDKLPTDSTELFQNATRINLALHPSNDQPAVAAIRDLLATLEREPSIAASLGEHDEAQLLAALVQRARRQADLDELREAVEDPKSSEGDLQKLIQRMTWIFSGEFLPGTARRNLTVLDQLDLALLRPDNTLHGVELKKANIKGLVAGEHNHLIPGTEVHKAVGQAMNYLRELDEKRPQILVDLEIDCRRASMTIVIGHSGLVTTGATRQEVDETIRTYNSHLSRVSVVTYDRLIENAQRILDLTTLDR
jgi:hypothetical protein